MKPSEGGNLAVSVHQRLMNHVRATGEDPNLTLTHFATERLLYRLSRSTHANQFVLKGAMMFLAWSKRLHRPTMDLDLLGFGEDSVERLERVFRDCCAVTCEPDGIVFDQDTVKAILIREDQEYQGKRVTLIARLGNARIPVQVDIGFGDVVTPAPERITFPAILDFPAPVVRAVTRETVIAEKLHAMVVRGIANSRMKDFFDVLALSRDFAFEGELLAKAITATFERRRTPIPEGMPLALSDEFAEDSAKKAQWNAFIRRSGLNWPEFKRVIAELRSFLLPVIDQAGGGRALLGRWRANGPWGR